MTSYVEKKKGGGGIIQMSDRELIVLPFAELGGKKTVQNFSKITEEPFSVCRGPAADKASPARLTQQRDSGTESRINCKLLW